MSIAIKYWDDFSKKNNSTKQPTTTGTTINCVLKEQTSVEAPTFIISGINTSMNYIQAFGNYYFVKDITFISATQMEVACELDPLASFKSAIGSSKQYVIYAAGASDFKIPDGRIVVKPNWIKSGYDNKSIKSGQTEVLTDSGYFAVTVVNDSGYLGSVTTYSMSAPELVLFAQELNATSGQAWDDLKAYMQDRMNNLFDAVVSVTYIPCPDPVASHDTIRVGNVTMSATGGKIPPKTLITGNAVLTPTHHYTDFRASSCAEKFQLFIPFYGLINISADDFNTSFTKLRMYYEIDAVTGNVVCVLTLYDEQGIDIVITQTVNYDIGVEVPLTHTQTGTAGSVLSAISGAVGTATALGTGNFGGALGGAMGVANSLIASGTVNNSVKGSRGSWAMNAFKNAFLISYYRETTDPADLATRQGRPVYDFRQINSFTGFVQCSDAVIDIPAMASEKSAIEAYMNSGFYYE